MNRPTGTRRGTVFFVVDDGETAGGPTRRVDGHWDECSDEADAGFIEQLPYGLSLESAITWARERSPRVLGRNDDPTFPMPTGHFWAGDAALCPPGVELMP